MQTSNFKQPFVIAVVIILAVTVIAVGLNSFTGQASWFSNFRRAPVQVEAQNLLGVHNGVVNIGGETLSFKIQAIDGKIEEITGLDWEADTVNYNGVSRIGVEPGVIKDLYSRENLQNPDRFSVKTLKIRTKGQSDEGFLIMLPNGQQTFETDTVFLAVQPNGNLGVYREEQDGSDAILAYQVTSGGSMSGDMWLVTDGGTRIRVIIEWN